MSSHDLYIQNLLILLRLVHRRGDPADTGPPLLHPVPGPGSAAELLPATMAGLIQVVVVIVVI